jgi:hypothetical protein
MTLKNIMMADTLDYERDLFIDESALDVEWLNQPLLMMRYSKQLAKAEKEVSRLKEKQRVVFATTDKDVRTNPGDYKISVKLTEEVVKNAVLSSDEYQDISAELIEAQYEYNMLKAAVESIKQRKDALQDLVRLHGQQYFAGPSIPRDLSHEAKQRHDKEVSNNSIKITRKKK